MGSPAVIILDDPTLGLDPAVRISLWQAIQSARDSTMSAFLITTHYIKEVADYLSAVKILDHGREVASGNPSALEGNFRLLLIIGGVHGGSFALGSLLRIVAACPGEMARCCSSSQLWCQANAHAVSWRRSSTPWTVVAGPDGWCCRPMRWRVNPPGGSAGRVPRLPLKGLTCALRG